MGTNWDKLKDDLHSILIKQGLCTDTTVYQILCDLLSIGQESEETDYIDTGDVVLLVQKLKEFIND